MQPRVNKRASYRLTKVKTLCAILAVGVLGIALNVALSRTGTSQTTMESVAASSDCKCSPSAPCPDTVAPTCGQILNQCPVEYLDRLAQSCGCQ